MGERVFVVGVGMTKFEKPGSRDWDYPDMGREAGQKALDPVEQLLLRFTTGIPVRPIS